MAQRIQFKLFLMMYNAMHGLALYIYPSSAQVPALKVELGRLLAATLQFSGRGQSSADVHSSSQVRRHGTGCRAPFATVRPLTVSRRR